jgi:hypothetical protein
LLLLLVCSKRERESDSQDYCEKKMEQEDYDDEEEEDDEEKREKKTGKYREHVHRAQSPFASLFFSENNKKNRTQYDTRTTIEVVRVSPNNYHTRNRFAAAG